MTRIIRATILSAVLVGGFAAPALSEHVVISYTTGVVPVYDMSGGELGRVKASDMPVGLPVKKLHSSGRVEVEIQGTSVLIDLERVTTRPPLKMPVCPAGQVAKASNISGAGAAGAAGFKCEKQ